MSWVPTDPPNDYGPMLISSAQIENYKGFHSTPELLLTHGFNVVVGQNDAGKTALIQALSLAFSTDPHRSLNVAGSGGSIVRVSLRFGADEFRTILRSSGAIIFDIPESEDENAAEERFRSL